MAPKLGKAITVLHRAIQATEMHLKKTGRSQDKDLLDTNFRQKAAHDGDGVYQFLYRIFALPPEIRESVWRFACGGNPIIRLAGCAANGIISTMLALKDPQLSAEGLMGVWKSFPIQWEGTLDSKTAWPGFRKTVIPHIRCLTITFELYDTSVFYRGTELGDTIAWMERRGKRGNRARYTWNLEQLHLIALGMHYSYGTSAASWSYWRRCPFPGSEHWSEPWALERLRKDGLKVTIDTKYDDRLPQRPPPAPWPWDWNDFF